MKGNKSTRALIIQTCLITILVLMGWAAPAASAQVLYGSVVGNLTDQTGALVPKAAVTATNTSTGFSRQATSDSSGYFSIPNLPEGTYDLSISATGFRPVIQKGVQILINNVTRADISLEVGA